MQRVAFHLYVASNQYIIISSYLMCAGQARAVKFALKLVSTTFQSHILRRLEMRFCNDSKQSGPPETNIRRLGVHCSRRPWRILLLFLNKAAALRRTSLLSTVGQNLSSVRSGCCKKRRLDVAISQNPLVMDGCSCVTTRTVKRLSSEFNYIPHLSKPQLNAPVTKDASITVAEQTSTISSIGRRVGDCMIHNTSKPCSLATWMPLLSSKRRGSPFQTPGLFRRALLCPIFLLSKSIVVSFIFNGEVSNLNIVANEHRDANGNLTMLEMQHLPCKSKFRVFEPLEEYREHCPKILVICHGEHSHPIPLPAKTPPSIRAELFDLLTMLDHDLPDLTPRRFLRHPAVNTFLRRRLPDVPNPTLLDLHPSLANRDHIRAYILQAQANVFPEGTGWEGMLVCGIMCWS